MEGNRTRALIEAALQASDDFVLSIVYLDSKGNATERIISPIRYLTPTRLSVYCLGRGEPRTLVLARIMRAKIGLASQVLAGSPESLRNLCIFKKSATGLSQRKRQD